MGSTRTAHEIIPVREQHIVIEQQQPNGNAKRRRVQLRSDRSRDPLPSRRILLDRRGPRSRLPDHRLDKQRDEPQQQRLVVQVEVGLAKEPQQRHSGAAHVAHRIRRLRQLPGFDRGRRCGRCGPSPRRRAATKAQDHQSRTRRGRQEGNSTLH